MVKAFKLIILFISMLYILSSCNHECIYCNGTGYVYSGCEYCDYSGYIIICSNCDHGHLERSCSLCEGDGIYIKYKKYSCDKTQKCYECKGLGFDTHYYQTCNKCNGTGEIICVWCNGTGTKIIETIHACPLCINGKVKCPKCNGNYRKICMLCNGGEKIICDHCDGTGEED